MKVSELQGAALDWAVAKAEELEVWREPDGIYLCEGGEVGFMFRPSTDWAQGGPIIEREVISLIHPKYDCWTAHCYDKTVDDESYTLDGPTPLIAAMRCFVASKLGDEIEVPDELKGE
jgi:hypothetical protein